MKALNVDQPWAELIMCGRKTIELRSRRTSHRGLLAIRATTRVLPTLAQQYGLDPDTLAVGAVVGTVELVEVIPMTLENWKTLGDKHMSLLPFPAKQYSIGWVLKNPRPFITPIPCKALRGMFTLPDEVVKQVLAAGGIRE